MNPQDEREICEIVKRNWFRLVFIYGYPTRKSLLCISKPSKPRIQRRDGLLCRGLEWLSGGRRINKYEQLLEHVKIWDMDPKKIKMFLEAFKYGVPPEGGFCFWC